MRYYVYELFDPSNNVVFYVGKGQKDRINQHEREAMKSGEVCSEKCKKIKEIWQRGFCIGKRKIKHFSCEKECLKFEAEMICEHGIENLTNVMVRGTLSRAVAKAYKRKDKPFDLVKQLSEKGNLLYTFIDWIKESDYGRYKVNVVSIEVVRTPFCDKLGNFYQFLGHCSQRLCDVFFPMAVKEIMSDQAKIDRFGPVLKGYGYDIERFNHGGA